MSFIGRKSRHGKGGANQTLFFMITRIWVIMPDRISVNITNTSFVANVYRVDGASWTQTPLIHYTITEQ